MPVLEPMPVRGPFGGEWLKLSSAAKEIVLNEALQPVDKLVFFFLATEAQYDNILTVNVTQLAQEMGHNRSTISLALSRLVEHGYLIKGPKDGRSSTYRLSPYMVWKGNNAGHSRALRKAEQRWGKAGSVDNPIPDSETLEEIPGQSTIEDALH